MKNLRRFDLLRVLALFSAWGLLTAFSLTADDADPEEAKEKSVTDRFVVVLEKNPRRGTALDKVYGFHVERGSLDGLISGYREKSKKTGGAEAGSAWMIVGLLEALRGQDAAAVASFEQAEKLANDNYLASYYLGQSLVLVGQPDKAAEALERSIQRKPAQADLLDVYQALGRVYQRAQKTEKALDVWNRLEKQFPNDARVQEQIATTLLEENEFAAALPRYERLAKNTKDRYRQSLFQMEAAEIKVRLGKSDEAIREFESLLSQLLPENWLYREVRRRIEAIYLKTDDQTGLIAYHEAWVKKFPQDLEAISRLSRLLAGFGRSAEAQAWLQSGLKVAPTKKELRQALISQFVNEQKYAEAIAQYEQLDKYEPDNPDTLREWGRLILKDTAGDDETRKESAAAIWRRLTDAKPNDAFIASQVGELFRRADMVDEALDLYRKAVSLAPEQSQYREYLGEYFHALQRKDEALATWRAIADGKLKTAPNLARLAEVLSSFGYLSEAIETHAEACHLDPKDFSLQVKHVDLLAQADKHEEALQQLAVVRKLAANDEEREAWLGRDLRELQAAEKLKDRIEEVADDEAGNAADRWFWLARAYEAERQMKEAAEAVTKAGTLAPQSIPILMASARIHEAQNNLMAAVEINTKLAAIDRRYRTEYLKQVATLEQKLGRRAKAIQAGRDLIAAAPGNPELYEFFSRLCFQLGEAEEGLSALRRSVRVNPADLKGLLSLASALKEQFRTSEAIELYWRAFDKAANLDDRLGIVPMLTELYLQMNQFDRLLERLERQRREASRQREMTICLAQAYQSAGDDGNARQELEKLLTEETRDIQLLTQLVRLCESDGDLEAAVKFQQQILKSTPGKDGMMRLAQLLTKSGETEEATAILSRITIEEKDPESVLKSLDALLTHGSYAQALGIVEKLTRDQPKNWELLYREGAALAASKERFADARVCFEAILALTISDDELSLAAKSQLMKPQGRGQPPLVRSHGFTAIMEREASIWEIRKAVRLDEDDNFNLSGRHFGGQQQQFWTPSDYGSARMACWAWLSRFAQEDARQTEFLQERREALETAAEPRELADAFYFSMLTSHGKDIYMLAKKLSMRPDADSDIKATYLASLSQREIDPDREEAVETEPAQTDESDEDGQRVPRLPSLDEEEMAHVLACFKSVENATSMLNNGESALQIVITELKRSGRKDEAATVLNDAIAAAKEPVQIALLLDNVFQANDLENTLKLLDRLAECKVDATTGQTQYSGAGFQYARYVSSPEHQSQILNRLIAWRARKKAMGDVLALWDRYLKMAVSHHDLHKMDHRTPTKRQRRRNQQQQYQSMCHVNVWRGQDQTTESFDYPLPNDIYNLLMIQVLRQVFVACHDAGSARDLIEHFQQKGTDVQTPDDEKIFWRFGLGYLHLWLEEKDEALQVLTAATAALPDNQKMKFELARLYEQRGEHDLALQIVDSLAATDQLEMQTREITALRMAVYSGNIARARLAAERLFGLRLDSNLQIQLAQQMHQLGMHELAEALLARAGRQAGNKTDVLLNLMQQYQSQGMNETAIQIAHQLLRRPKNNSGGVVHVIHGQVIHHDNDGGVRRQALVVLKRSGKLSDMIARVESQLTNSPKSQRLIEILIEYYSANGDREKLDAMAAKIGESKQDDPEHRFRLGQQLLQQGKYKEAAEHIKFAFKQKPQLMQNQIWNLTNAVNNTDEFDFIGSILDEVDFKFFRQNSWELMSAISDMSENEKTMDHAMRLFKRAWKDLPDERQQLLQSLGNESIWQMPEIYDYARQGIIPTETSVRRNNGWPGFGQIQNWGREGKLVTLMNRFLTMAAANGKLDELADEVLEAQNKLKKWEGARALLALIDLRRGKIDEARSVLEKLLPTFKGMQQGQFTRWEIAVELMDHEQCAELAIRYFESACREPELMSMNDFQHSPGKPLVMLYKRLGRKDDLRRILLEASHWKPDGNHRQRRDWDANQRIHNVQTMVPEMIEAGFAIDAIHLYQKELARTEDFTTHQRGEQMRKVLEAGLETAIKGLKPELLPELLMGSRFCESDDEPASALEPANDMATSVAVMPLVESSELYSMTMSSTHESLMALILTNPGMIEKTNATLADVRSKRPDDFATLILTAQLALRSGQTPNTTIRVRELVELTDKLPLDAQPAKGGFTARQRDAAMEQTALWLVARDCLKQESLRTAGTKLGERALEAARRQSDNEYALAILREWGQIAVESGDREMAERRWSEMLETILAKPSYDSKNQIRLPRN